MITHNLFTNYRYVFIISENRTFEEMNMQVVS